MFLVSPHVQCLAGTTFWRMKEWTKSTTQETKGQRGWKGSVLHRCKPILSIGKRSWIRNTPNWDQFCKIIFEIKEGPFITMFAWRRKEAMVSGQKQRQPFLSLSHYLVQIPAWEEGTALSQGPRKGAGTRGLVLALPQPVWVSSSTCWMALFWGQHWGFFWFINCPLVS